MIYNSKQLANQLKLLRNQKQLTQTELAKRVGIKQSTLSNFENYPETTQLQTVFKIIQALEAEMYINESIKQPLTIRESAPSSLNTLTDEEW